MQQGQLSPREREAYGVLQRRNPNSPPCRPWLVMVGLAASGAALVILTDTFYAWVHVGIQRAELMLGLGLVACMAAALFLTASGRRVGIIAIVLPPAWLVAFSGWADFPIPAWQIIVGLMAGVTMWHAVHFHDTRGIASATGRIVFSVGLWTIAAEPIVRAVVMRNLYGIDFFIT